MYITMNGRQAVRADAASQMLAISQRHVHNLLNDGLLEFETVGRQRWIFVDSINDLIAARKKRDEERASIRRYGFVL